MSPAVATDLPLEVVTSLVVDCFFGTMTWWRGFLMMSVVGEKPKRWDSNDESTSLWCRFSYAIDQMIDLTPQARRRICLE